MPGVDLNSQKGAGGVVRGEGAELGHVFGGGDADAVGSGWILEGAEVDLLFLEEGGLVGGVLLHDGPFFVRHVLSEG